ncbi:type II toxin-antitoxin system RelE/ParE family toxin [Legionella dresdenensis]|uniref:Type II toxin-antitoxin system RelE/ParE family toxin n=1 Tax=Legionella dresdenensis TaxID=450200 RepID=A0ABV8CD42_9GAMM
MNWKIIFQEDFDLEFDELSDLVQNECLAHLKVLERFGPELGRPHVDTLKGSKHSNMKELRFNADNGVWRLAFAFDPPVKGFCLFAAINQGEVKRDFIKI